MLREHPLIRPISGSLASCAAECATLPIDLLKVRLQVARGAAAPGALATITRIVQQEGPAALFMGIEPALYRMSTYQAIRMGIYEPLRDVVCAAGRGEDGNAQPKLWQMIIAGGLAGMIGVFIASPFDLIKVRMQSGLLVGTRTFPALNAITSELGVAALWAGAMPACQRSFVVGAAELATYDSTKRWLLRFRWLSEGVLVHTLSSIISGFVAALASTPLDRAKTMLMADSTHSSMLGCLAAMWNDRGLLGLWQGFLASWMRLGPWSFLFFVIFEQLRAFGNRLQQSRQKID